MNVKNSGIRTHY